MPTAPKCHQTRQKLIEIGRDLFYRYGFQSVGLDRIVKQADLTKTTFYNHFDSKEELIQEVIEYHEGQIRSEFSAGVLKHGGDDPQQRILAVFDVLQQFFAEQEFKGCMLINVVLVFPDPNDPIHQTAVRNKTLITVFFAALAKAAGLPQPDAFATKLHMLMDGAIISRHAFDDQNAAATGKQLAAALLFAELQPNKLRVDSADAESIVPNRKLRDAAQRLPNQTA